jgi:CheY-like chemotaxis protein
VHLWAARRLRAPSACAARRLIERSADPLLAPSFAACLLAEPALAMATSVSRQAQYLARCCVRAHDLGDFARKSFDESRGHAQLAIPEPNQATAMSGNLWFLTTHATRPIQTGVISKQPMRTRGLAKLLGCGLGADQLLRTDAARRLRRGLGVVAEGAIPTARVVRPRVDEGNRTQVLVIDRDREVVELLAYVLCRAGIDFLAVHDAAAALEILSTRQPRVVVLGPYELDVFEQLQANGDDTAIIVLTAAESDHAGTTSGVAVADYLTKPFSCTGLVASIHACLLRDRRDSPDVR